MPQSGGKPFIGRSSPERASPLRERQHLAGALSPSLLIHLHHRWSGVQQNDSLVNGAGSAAPDRVHRDPRHPAGDYGRVHLPNPLDSDPCFTVPENMALVTNNTCCKHQGYGVAAPRRRRRLWRSAQFRTVTSSLTSSLTTHPGRARAARGPQTGPVSTVVLQSAADLTSFWGLIQSLVSPARSGWFTLRPYPIPIATC